MPTNSNLFKMLHELAEDDTKREDFYDNPDDVMDTYNLTQAQKDLINSSLGGSEQDLYKAIGDEAHTTLGDLGSNPDLDVC